MSATPVPTQTLTTYQAELDSAGIASILAAIQGAQENGANVITLPSGVTSFAGLQNFNLRSTPNGGSVTFSIKS